MTSGEKKFIIWFGLVLALWRIVELPAVQNAFLQFLAVGQLPITHKTLSPKGVFLVLAASFSLSLLLVFRKELVRSMRRRRNELVAPDTETVVISRNRRAAAAFVPAPKLALKDRALPMVYIPSIRPFARKIGVFVRRAAAAEYDSLKTIFTFVWRVVVFASLVIWRFWEPRIRRFDKWLEGELRKNHITSELIEAIEESWRAVTSSHRKTDKREDGKQA